MFQYKVKCLFPKDINPQQDTFLGETSVQIKGFGGYPSIHKVKSYAVESEGEKDREEGNFYHIFEFQCGTTAINYNQKEFQQVRNFIGLSHHWNVFYRDCDKDVPLIPIPKQNFLNDDELSQSPLYY